MTEPSQQKNLTSNKINFFPYSKLINPSVASSYHIFNTIRSRLVKLIVGDKGANVLILRHNLSRYLHMIPRRRETNYGREGYESTISSSELVFVHAIDFSSVSSSNSVESGVESNPLHCLNRLYPNR